MAEPVYPLSLEEIFAGPVIEVFEEPNGVAHRIHLTQECSAPCPFHNPSRHHMVKWPATIRGPILVERLCEHGIGHPDPDSVRFLQERTRSSAWGTHGCDGCCRATDEVVPMNELGEAEKWVSRGPTRMNA